MLKDQPGKVVIESITGDNGRLSLDPADNCVGIAAMETLKLLGSPSCGVSLTLHKVCWGIMQSFEGLQLSGQAAIAGPSAT